MKYAEKRPPRRTAKYAPTMRHHSVLEDSREMILAELEQSKADRTEPHAKPPRAAEFERAIAAVKAGAVEVRVKNAVYRVVGEQRPRQYLITEDGRERVLEALRSYGETAGGKRAEEYAQAIEAIDHGALVVFVDGEMYRVVED
jgi:hypothetical protein